MSAVVGVLLIAAGLALLRVELKVRATGVVYCESETRLYAPTDGTVTRIPVTLGDEVRAGDVVLALDDADLILRELELDRQIAQTEAALARQEVLIQMRAIRPAPLEAATAAERRRRLDRIVAIQTEIERDFASALERQAVAPLEAKRQELLRLEYELALAEAEVLARWKEAGLFELEARVEQIDRDRLERELESLRRERDLVRREWDRRTIRAPHDGQIIALKARHEGMAVARGEEVAKIARTGAPARVRAYVPERNVDLIRPGAPALMASKVFESYLEGPIRGRVLRVAPSAESDEPLSGPPRYEVELEVVDTPHRLVLGSRLDVEILLGRHSIARVLLRTAGRGRERSER